MPNVRYLDNALYVAIMKYNCPSALFTYRKIMKKLLSIVVISAVLSGCQATAPLNFSVPNVGLAKKKVDAELRSMTVSIARPDEKTGDLPAGMEVMVPQLWQASLQEAINRMTVFKDDASTKVNLSVKILKLNVPSAGISFTTQAAARYEIINRSNGDIIFTQDIASDGLVPMDYAFVGVTRQRESINRAVQNNIAQFLQALESVNTARPMFPAVSSK